METSCPPSIQVTVSDKRTIAGKADLASVSVASKDEVCSVVDKCIQCALVWGMNNP